MRTDADYQSPEYKKWRLSVFKRDGFCCVLCGASSPIVAHHIKRWADYPDLRFKRDNGATLCKQCHSKVTGLEVEYESILNSRIRKIKPKYDKFDIDRMLNTGVSDESLN